MSTIQVFPTEAEMLASERQRFGEIMEEVVRDGRRAADADPTYGTPDEAVRRYRRIGPYSDQAGACEARGRARTEYCPPDGFFDARSRVGADRKTGWLEIRFIPRGWV